MQYLMIICHDDSFVPTEALVSDIIAWDKEMDGGESGSMGTRCGRPVMP
jgi:hypothetical protein